MQAACVPMQEPPALVPTPAPPVPAPAQATPHRAAAPTPRLPKPVNHAPALNMYVRNHQPADLQRLPPDPLPLATEASTADPAATLAAVAFPLLAETTPPAVASTKAALPQEAVRAAAVAAAAATAAVAAAEAAAAVAAIAVAAAVAAEGEDKR